MTEPLPVEALTRIDLKPSEILAIASGADWTPHQCREAQEWLEDWLAQHGVQVAGVLVLPKGSKLTAIQPQAKALPEIGDVVHICDATQPGCLVGPVTATCNETLQVEAAKDPRCSHWLVTRHDETRTIDGSWHWPCDVDTAKDGEPQPDAAAPQITIHVHGSVLAERDLDAAIQRAWRRANDISRYTRR